MKNSAVLSLAIGVLLTSCATEGQMAKEPIVSDWPGSEIFQLAQEGGFQWETLEIKDGRFRYWFSSDVIGGRPQKYPIKGSYESKGDQLVLSSGKPTPSVSLMECVPFGRHLLWIIGSSFRSLMSTVSCFRFRASKNKSPA